MIIVTQGLKLCIAVRYVLRSSRYKQIARYRRTRKCRVHWTSALDNYDLLATVLIKINTVMYYQNLVLDISVMDNSSYAWVKKISSVLMVCAENNLPAW